MLMNSLKKMEYLLDDANPFHVLSDEALEKEKPSRFFFTKLIETMELLHSHNYCD